MKIFPGGLPWERWRPRRPSLLLLPAGRQRSQGEFAATGSVVYAVKGGSHGTSVLEFSRTPQRKAEQLANRQGVSLNQFIVWAVAEKVGSLKQSLDDPRFPRISYRSGAAGRPEPVLRGTRIRVQTIVVATRDWGSSPAQVAEELGVPKTQVEEALAFYEAHRGEIDASLAEEQQLEARA